ncbi:MAG: hypothetical protein DRN20_02155 [Thermoplasmata archaeon]|nr:MAG: hypothetical protein DRN20_02155 [Thermoplasmata archaeon]
MKYIMVSNINWARVRGRRRYTIDYLRGGMEVNKLKENTETIFIQLHGGEIKNAWFGKVCNIEIGRDRKSNKIAIWFNPRIDGKMPNPKEYADYPIGWYVEGIPENSIITPPLFQILEETNNWRQFEQYTYYLLKLLGIHNIHTYREQKGEPDGVFKVKNLVVIYDCSLKRDLDNKSTQIKNYCDMLLHDRVSYREENGGRRKIPTYGCKKRVWIITRGIPREIEKVGEVLVKEVPIYSLIDLYMKRVIENYDEEKLELELLAI